MTRSSPFFPTLNLPPVHPHQPTIGVVSSALDVASGVLSRVGSGCQALCRRALRTASPSVLIGNV